MVFEKPADLKTVAAQIVNRINESSRRIRLLEHRIEKTESRLSGIERTVLTQLDDLKISLERLNSRISSLADKITSLENEDSRMNKRLEKTVTKAEIKELEVFIDLIRPMTSSFVTKDELEGIIRKPKKA
jgi:chromosome segregation ATPase